MKRSLATLTAAAIAAVLLGWPLAGTASAHVTVQAPGATANGFTKLTFRAPTEKAVPTTKLDITFPPEAPVASVSVKPHPGWTYNVTKAAPATPLTAHGRNITEVVTNIVWTAAGDGIKPGEFDEFEVSAGPLPSVETMTFKALQTYADGDVVRWIEQASAGATEPEHPAPVLRIAKANPPEPTTAAPAPIAASTSSGESDTTGTVAIVLAAAALVVAVVAVVLAARGKRLGASTT